MMWKKHVSVWCSMSVLVVSMGCSGESGEDMPDEGVPDMTQMVGDAVADLPEEIQDIGPDSAIAPDAMMDDGAPDASEMVDMLDMDDMSPDLGPGDMDMGREPVQLPDLTPLRDAIASDLMQSNATAASVAIWYEGEVIWLGGFGEMTDGAGVKRAPDEETMFMIGSDTKKMSSILYLQHVAKMGSGATLQTRIEDVVPSFTLFRAPEFPTATAHALMSNQGGLVDYLGPLTTSTMDSVLEDYTLNTLSSLVYQLAPPGEFYNYSNPSFSALGLMTERLDGTRPWADIAEQDLFAPLEMTRSVARKSSVDPVNHARGIGITTLTQPMVEEIALEQTWEDAYIRPAGLVWSTPTDQMKLAKFLIEGDAAILPDDLRLLISSPQTPLYPDIPGDYGYGLVRNEGVNLGLSHYPNMVILSHGGNTLTHSSTFYILPQERFAISILSNGRGDNFAQSVVEAIRLFVELPQPGQAPEVPFDPDALDLLTGEYVDPNNVGKVFVTREGDTLFIDMPDVTRAGVPYERKLERVSTRVWMSTIQGQSLPLAFFDGSGFKIFMANRAFVATKSPGLVIGLEQGPPDVATIRAALERAKFPSVTDPLFDPLLFGFRK